MWSYVLCLALLAPAVFAKSVTLDELKRALTDYIERNEGADIVGDVSGLFESKELDGPLIGGGPGAADKEDTSSVITGNLFGGVADKEDTSAVITDSLFGPSDRSGPMAQMDMRSLFQEEKRDVEGMSNRLVEAVKEAQAAVDAGEQVVKKKSTSATKRADRVYTMCVFCDDMCLAQISSAGYSSDSYFAAITTKMNSYLASLDADGIFSLSFKLLPYMSVYMDWFGDSSLTGQDLLSAINEAFWDGTGLYDMANGYGCDVDFLMASDDDPAWNDMGSVEGIANMMQLCQLSFSVVKMSDSPTSTAMLMAHEFGHMIGAYHDGTVNSAYSSLDSYFQPGQLLAGCADEYNALNSACTAGSAGIMSSVVGGSSTFSDCSVAYFNTFLCLADVLPSWYSVDCVQ